MIYEKSKNQFTIYGFTKNLKSVFGLLKSQLDSEGGLRQIPVLSRFTEREILFPKKKEKKKKKRLKKSVLKKAIE